jgi:phosphoribosyl-ATP pyrophosphohydrolase/phosphoribosyl-AMP cyclohydrolase
VLVSQDLKLDDKALIPAIVQDRLTGQVRMMAWMNREALEKTLTSGKATFFSRSRGTLWQKGESSGNWMAVRQVLADCDADTLLLLVDPVGPSCHTGQPSCFFRTFDGSGIHDQPVLPGPFLLALESEIDERKSSTAAKSYTKSLLIAGPSRIGEKVREEAGEFAEAIASESEARVASEAADVVYHLLVGLSSRGVPFRAVVDELARRAGISGHDEKAARPV